MNQYFLFNVSFFAFTTMPEKFPITQIFVFEDALHHMLVCAHRKRVWN